MRTLLKQLVIGHVEYGCVLWAPYTQQQINYIESVQRRFTRKFPCYWQYDSSIDRSVCHVSYKERLMDLKLYSLERRRERYMILLLYKVAIKLIPNPGLVVDTGLRGRWYFQRKFTTNSTIPAWIRKARNNGFFSNGPLLFNSLPGYLRLKQNTSLPPSKAHLTQFKKRLDVFLDTIEDDPGTTANSLIRRIGLIDHWKLTC